MKYQCPGTIALGGIYRKTCVWSLSYNLHANAGWVGMRIEWGGFWCSPIVTQSTTGQQITKSDNKASAKCPVRISFKDF